MSYHHFYKALHDNAHKLFPSVSTAGEVAWDHLISPLEVQLPRSVFDKAQAAIRALHRLSSLPDYESRLEPVAGISQVPVKNHSLLMAYDFHTTEDGHCYLVEVNTNASGFLLSALMEITHTGSTPDQHGPLQRLAWAFTNEAALSGHSGQDRPRLAISDEDIAQQKMLVEFLMYRDWLRARGWDADLCEGRDLKFTDGELRDPSGRRVNFVYNRLTDFYLEDPAYSGLRQAYLAEAACVSPNPKVYWRLADKDRLIQWGQPGFLEQAGASAAEAEAVRSILIPTYGMKDFASPDDIWAERKHLFFKPRRSYGGKSVYRGESVSRKVFERLMAEDILIQRYQPPQKMPSEDPRSVLSNWKFDVRFYVYADEVQLVAARIYQGQVTNFSSPMGGFTLVRFK